MSKTIVFCADGTWNNPGEDENHDSTPDPTNVYKLFTGLAGELDPDTLLLADEQEKVLNEGGAPTQVAKYLHGVGDSSNPIIKLLGGAFGAGIISRIVRGYTFLSRNYQAGDALVILGFSRGAYTARALAGLVAHQGLLAPSITADREKAYRCGAKSWYAYRQATVTNAFSLAHLAEIVSDLPAFLSQSSLQASDLVPVDQLLAVGVWDTVGAMGFPDYTGGGQRVDAFKFADTKLSPKALNGFHAVALDERRGDFEPTLWDPEPRIAQVLFPGAHADVGGGYPAVNRESGLSDGALLWMQDQLAAVGVRFNAAWVAGIQPDAAGPAHQPWIKAPWTLPGMVVESRTFPVDVMKVDSSIPKRQAAGPVQADPSAQPAPYAPTNLP
jgi:uncharacterized protein (DUF2235 family)